MNAEEISDNLRYLRELLYPPQITPMDAEKNQ